ncbi:TonB-dependent receptor [Pseudoduganella eburnea]|uniref:TonB-dependent receptor n=1 Tax=Massilia eburnea TaxID=1776165 RepID=A0A6L6QLT2_9BURK|nr:TonB-dependent receptor [Massilia eburnea]MTW12666.1 TonB-dependent receptor [Massilia eburnea]
MNFKYSLLAGAVLSAVSAIAHADDGDVTKVVVTANPFHQGETEQILVPAKVLSGDELRDKMSNSLGDTLSSELGVSTSAFGAGSSRPIIRGLEGARVKMLENGMAVSDVSGLSNDHAVSAEGAVAHQIEILRGPASLMYGSGAIGGLVNVVNERIPPALEPKLTGQVETRYSSVDDGTATSGTIDGAVGKLALHVDANTRQSGDYKIPGNRVEGDPDSASGRLPHSGTHEKGAGFGGSYIDGWGYVGASVSSLDNKYGIPTAEGSAIDQHQVRYDFDSLFKNPLPGIESAKFKAGYTDYHHAELGDDGQPEVKFKNRSVETRADAVHKAIDGWHGTFGVQTELTHFSALSAQGGPDTVPVTRSNSSAGFLVEEKEWGPVRVNAGVRLEHVKREPVSGLDRSFSLQSGALGALWSFTPGYATGLTLSRAQRAPSTEELYSGGPHDATITYDVGDPNLSKETSRNVEFSLQKTAGLIRWKANLFRNSISDFIYGHVTGRMLDEEGQDGGEFRQRIFSQGDATIRGAEAEIEYNPLAMGLNGRLFADTSHGDLKNAGSLPLQPASRVGASIGYRTPVWRAGATWIHAQAQDRLASFETAPTGSYNQVSANLSYTQKLADMDLTWFVLAKNLLNEDIRVSTSLLKDVSPLPGRSFVFGVRAKF